MIGVIGEIEIGVVERGVVVEKFVVGGGGVCDVYGDVY